MSSACTKLEFISCKKFNHREELTDEWDKRGIKVQREYAILTSEISNSPYARARERKTEPFDP